MERKVSDEFEIKSENSSFYKEKESTESGALERSSKINDIKNRFIKSFFAIPRGQTSKLNAEIMKVLKPIRNFLPNFELEKPLVDDIIKVFNEYHSEENELIVKQGREFFANVSKSFKLKDECKTLFFSKKSLDDEKNRFFNEIFSMEVFQTEKIMDLFDKHISGFIENFNSNNKRSVEMFCIGLEEEYFHTMNTLTGIVNSKLSCLIAEKKTVA